MKKAPKDLSPTDTIAHYLDVFGRHQPIKIISGIIGGDNRAKFEDFTWKHNARAVILALAKARKQGTYWAIAVIKIDKDRMYGMTYGDHADNPGCNLETGEIVTYPQTEEPTDDTDTNATLVKTI